MTPLRAEFKPRPAPAVQHWRAASVLLLVALASLVWAWRQAQLVRDAETELARINDTNARMHAAVVPPPRQPMPQGTRALLKQRALPWPQALYALESVALPGITLRSIDADSEQGQVLIEIAATDHASALAYLERLDVFSRLTSGGSVGWKLLQTRRDAASGEVLATISGFPGAP